MLSCKVDARSRPLRRVRPGYTNLASDTTALLPPPFTGNPGAVRMAVINFLGGLETAELAPLYRHVLEPFARVFGDSATWAESLSERAGGSFMTRVDQEALARVPMRVRAAFLNAAADMMVVLPQHTAAYLDPLMSLTVHILTLAVGSGADAEAGRHGTLWRGGAEQGWGGEGADRSHLRAGKCNATGRSRKSSAALCPRSCLRWYNCSTVDNGHEPGPDRASPLYLFARLEDSILVCFCQQIPLGGVHCAILRTISKFL